MVDGDGGEAVLRVRDAGVGIPAEMLERIFETDLGTDGLVDRFASTPNAYWVAVVFTAIAALVYVWSRQQGRLEPLAREFEAQPEGPDPDDPDDLGADLCDLPGGHGLDRAVGTDGHEGRCVESAVRRDDAPCTLEEPAVARPRTVETGLGQMFADQTQVLGGTAHFKHKILRE